MSDNRFTFSLIQK